MPAAVNHFKKNKKKPGARQRARSRAHRRRIRASHGRRSVPLGEGEEEQPAGPQRLWRSRLDTPTPLQGRHHLASRSQGTTPTPPRGSLCLLADPRHADASSPAVVEVPTSWPWWIPASWLWWRSTVGSGCSTARSTEEEGAAARSMGEEVTTAGSVEEEVAVAGSGERKREE